MNVYKQHRKEDPESESQKTEEAFAPETPTSQKPDDVQSSTKSKKRPSTEKQNESKKTKKGKKNLRLRTEKC
jgi:hypothetical protein